ncbi:MAG: hypothetical protein HN855_08115 [Anaerolineae bacterium]|jgi:hypothetical protein|nr:hypothetical protein [Anaerolineae bacterium]MBT7325107.1 hypothetical protein [Anaerolineae bacterium]
MHTDLFHALLDDRNKQARGNPILPALLYAYCPAAAGWWLAGETPEPVFDVVWQVLEDYSAGKTLKDALTDYEIGEAALPDIEQYIGEVATYRSHHPMSSPERSQLFPGGRFDPSHRLGSQIGIRRMGSWQMVLEYARVWAFLLYDWRGGMQISPDVELVIEKEWLALHAPGVRKAAYFPVWVWRENFSGKKRNHIGLFVVDGRGHDQLRFALVQSADRVGEKSWKTPPLVFGLQRQSGEAELFKAAFPLEELLKMVLPMGEQASQRRIFPLQAVRNPQACLQCGFQEKCYADQKNRRRQLPLFGDASLKMLNR